MPIINLIVDRKRDIFVFSIVVILFFILLLLFWKNQGSVLIDSGVDPYLAQEFANGKLYIKDYMNFYGPLSYQFNTLLIIIFGHYLNIFIIAGIINTILILLLLYLIARNFTNPYVALIINVLILVFCVFSNYFPNNSYILPYSFSIIYAISSYLLSILLCIYYMKSSKSIYVILSGFFITVSVLCKYEFIFYVFIYLAIILVVKPVNKNTLKSIVLACLVMPLVCWGSIFLQGLSLKDISENYKYLIQFTHAPILKNFYTFHGVLPSFEKLSQTLFSFITFITVFCLVSISLYLLIKIFMKLSSSLKFLLAASLIVLVLLYQKDIEILIWTLNPYPYLLELSSWLPLCSLIIALYVSYSSLKKQNKNSDCENSNILISLVEKVQNLNVYDQSFIFVGLCALVASTKVFIYSNFYFLGIYLMLLNILVLVIFIFEYLPDLLHKLDKQKVKISFAIVMVLLACLQLYCTNIKVKIVKRNPVSTQYGTIYANEDIAKAINQAIKYIDKYASNDSKMLVLPRGAMINFLTNKSTGCSYIFLEPILIETFTEDKIINDLKKNKPDFILVTREDLSYFNHPLKFGEDFGLKINDFILNEYDLVKETGDTFKIKIYNNSRY